MKSLLYKACLFNLFVVCSFTAYTQSDSLKIDSLKKVLLTEKDDTNKVNTLNAISNRLYLLGDIKNVNQYAYQALSLSKKINFKRGEGYAYLTMTDPNGDYANNLKDYYAGLKVYTEIGDKYGIALSLQDIGGIYEFLGNDSEALKSWNASLKIREEIGDKKGTAQSYVSIADICSRQGNYTEALEKDFAALKIFQGPGMPKWGTPVSYLSIAYVYEEQGDFFYVTGDRRNAANKYRKALTNALLALKYDREINSTTAISESCRYIGDINMKLKKFSEAAKYLRISLQVAKESHNQALLLNVYGSLATLDSIRGNYKEAFEHYKLHTLYRDSLYNEETTKKSMQTRMQYEFDEKEAIAKAEQDKKDAIAKAEIQNQKISPQLFLYRRICSVKFYRCFFLSLSPPQKITKSAGDAE